MESSRRYLLQAEIEYWHEMLRLNRNRIPDAKTREMRHCLREAIRSLNALSVERIRLAA